MVYLVAERPEGASLRHLQRLGLGDNPAADEIQAVSEAVSQLLGEGQITIDDKNIVLPAELTPSSPQKLSYHEEQDDHQADWRQKRR